MERKQLLEKMKLLKLWGMYRSFQGDLYQSETERYTPDELLGMLLASEWDDRQARKIQRLITSARFRYMASVEELIYLPERELEKNQIMRFADCDYIAKRQNILITGSTGVGKSYLACALGHQACLRGYKVSFFNLAKLLARLKMMKADGSYLKEISRLEKQDLLILDDFGLQPIDNQSQLIFLEIIEDRYDRKATILTSQLPVGSWYEVIDEKTIADAILDRLVHGAYRVNIKGDSMRKTRKRVNQNNE
jgi:DNA replication protein DnaC